MKLPSALTLSSLFAFSVHGAIIINVTTVDNRVFAFPPEHVEVLDSEGEFVDEGNRVLIGTFDTGTDTPTEFFGVNQGDLVSMFTSFIPISDDFRLEAVGNRETIFSGPGTFATTGTSALPALNTPADFGLTDSSPIYLWILKTDDNGSDIAPDFSNVTEYGLFTSTNSAWNFADGSPLRSVTLRTQDIDVFNVSSGGLRLANVSDLVVIPEPSVFALMGGLLALSGLTLRRRR